MSDLLKEAIADAKAVRETALQNAKMALEEAFTPQLKSILSAKLKEDELEEGEPVLEDEDEDEVEADEGAHEDEVPAEEGQYEDEDFGGDDEEEAEEGAHEEVEEEGIIEIDGVKYAPVVAEEEEDDDDDEDEVEEELDLEAVIKELESELSEGEDEDDDDKEDVDETVEEEYEIDEAALTEDDDDEKEVEESVEDDSSELSEVQAELKEYKEAVHFLKDKLHEVNILNAKLLFTNKLFKEFSLDNGQKLKVVETFDRAQTTREIKLVYSTLAEQFGDNGSIKTRKSISESASSAVASTKPSKESRKVITEESQVANRFKKLAGLL